MHGANPARGEAALTVGGERVILRPSFEALVAAEEELGPLFALVERAAEGALKLSAWTDAGWRFIAPVPGMQAWDKAAGLWVHWTGSAWTTGELPASKIVVGGKKVVGERQSQVPSPSGGTVIDTEARAAIAALIVALRSHGLTD